MSYTEDEEKDKSENRWAAAIILAAGSPIYLLIWMGYPWAVITFKVYVMTAPVFGYGVLYLERKSLNKGWLWSCVTPLFVVHSVAMYGLVQLNMAFPEMDRFPVATYGALAPLVMGEGLVVGFILDRFRPKEPSDPR
jgi:hypothetical protein